MENIRTIVCRNFNRLVEASPLTKKEIARQMQVDQSTLQRWKNGETFPELANIEKLAKILGVNDSEFYAPLETPEKPVPVRIQGKTTDILRELIYRREKIPEDIIDMAQGFELTDEVWEEVREAFEDAIKRRKTSQKNHSLPGSNGA